MTFIFYYRYLIDFVGLPAWGNYIIPITLSAINPPSFLNYYQYNSILTVTPESTFLSYYFLLLPIITLSRFLPIFVSEKLYVFISTIFFALSVYYLSGKITRSFFIRMLSLAFFLFNPFMIMILSEGDSLLLVAQSFVLISLGLLIDFLRNEASLLNYKWVFSVLFLSLSIVNYQPFILGTLLYLIVFTYFFVAFRQGSKIRLLSTFIIYISITIILLFILVLPDLLGSFLSSGGTSLIAIPSVENLIGNGVSVWNLLILKGYPPNVGWLAVQKLNGIVYNIWEFIFVCSLMFLLLLPVIQLRLRKTIISLTIVFFSFLGAGKSSILFPLNSYLFQHFPGYASLNASYLWDWFIILPLYFFLITIPPTDSHSRHLPHLNSISIKKIMFLKTLNKRRIYTCFALFLVFVITIPIVSQGYYSNNGINNSVGENIPASYQQIGCALQKLGGNSTGGVAFFNPDYSLFFNNTSNNFYNPYLSFPVLRTAGLQYYGVASTTSTRYFYWVYSLFYKNQTRYLGSLMGLAGIKFFVILNNTNSYSYGEQFMPFSEGKNATKLMHYQYGVKQIYAENGFSIFQNMNYTGTAVSVSNLTLISGGFNELATLPYYGFNISSLGVFMSQDINITNFKSLMSRVTNIVIPTYNSLDGIVLRGISKSLQISNYASSEYPSDGWVNSLNYPSAAYYGCVEPFAVTSAKNVSITLDPHISNAGNYTVFFQMYHYTSPNIFFPTETSGQLELIIDNRSWTFNASSITSGYTNAFIWEDVKSYLTPGENLTIKNTNGWNELGVAQIVPTNMVNQAFTAFDKYLNSSDLKIFQIVSGGNIAPKNSPENYYPETNDSNLPLGSYGWLDSLNSSKLDSLNIYTPIENGTLFLKVIVDGAGGLMNVSYANNSYYIGFQPQNFSSPESTNQSYLTIPFIQSEGHIKIQLLMGEVYFVSILIQNRPLEKYELKEISITPVLNNYFIPNNQNVTITKLRTILHNNIINFCGVLNYSGPQITSVSTPLITLNYNLMFPYNLSMIASLNISNGFYLSINSVFVGNTRDSYYGTSAGVYGSVVRDFPLLNVDVYDIRPIMKQSDQINFSLNISFLNESSLYTFNSNSQITKEINLKITSSGYIVLNSLNLTIIRLPYYSLMSSKNAFIRLSSISGLNQIIFSESTPNVVIYTSYQSITVSVAYTNAIFIILLLIIPVMLKKRSSSQNKR